MSEPLRRARIWIVDDDADMRESLHHLLESAGFSVRVFSEAEAVPQEVARGAPDAVLTDVRMPRMSGLELLSALAAQADPPPVVLISAHGDIPMAVEAMRAGAYSFLEKPYQPQRLITVLTHAVEQRALGAANRRLRERLVAVAGLDAVLLGDSAAMAALREQVLDVADLDVPVLVTGETGTGKDIVARALHDLGRRKDGPFVAVNSAAIPPAGFEEMMFGQPGVEGYLSRADGGTLFLDELAGCDPAVQAKLLRALDAGEIAPVGGQPMRVAFRVVGASAQDLDAAVRAGRFREDLFYRLNALTLDLPPLRQRREDVPLLFTRFLEEQARVFEIDPPILTTEDMTALMAHDWPGNVRELRNVATRRVLAARRGRGSVAEALHLDEDSFEAADNLRAAVAAFERQLILRTVRAHKGRMDPAAEALGIGRRTLNEKMVKLNLTRDDVT